MNILKNKKALFIFATVSIDLFIIFTANRICPNFLIAYYIKAFAIQIVLFLMVIDFPLVRLIISKYDINIGNFYLLMMVLLLISFFMLWIGTAGAYVFGGQSYCNMSDVPEYMNPFK